MYYWNNAELMITILLLWIDTIIIEKICELAIITLIIFLDLRIQISPGSFTNGRNYKLI